MAGILRSVLAVVAGTIVAGLLVGGVEAISSALYPFPPGMDPNDPKALDAFIKDLPLGAFLLVLAAYGIGTTVGTWVASRIARRGKRIHGAIVGLLMLAAGVATMATIPHPTWFAVAAVSTFLAATYLGTRNSENGGGRKDGIVPELA